MLLIILNSDLTVLDSNFKITFLKWLHLFDGLGEIYLGLFIHSF